MLQGFVNSSSDNGNIGNAKIDGDLTHDERIEDNNASAPIGYALYHAIIANNSTQCAIGTKLEGIKTMSVQSDMLHIMQSW